LTDAPSDLIGELINNTPNDDAGRALLYGESRLIISAGSETTSTALTFIFIQLAINPRYARAIRAEHHANASTYHCSRPLPILDAVIKESMRLWPSVFFGPQRVTPPEGLSINGRFIPGNIIVQAPPFVLNRDIRNKAVFLPFSMGQYSCVGKSLAWMELRSVVGRVLNEFDVVLPENFVEEKYWEGIKEHFTAGPPRQEVRFVKVGE
jgi:cytochrome P450